MNVRQAMQSLGTTRLRTTNLTTMIFVGVMLLSGGSSFSQAPAAFNPVVPKTWEDAAIRSLEVPLANPVGSPKHILADYYYRIPVRPIYKQYPVYAPGSEPAGYTEWLEKQEPVIVWDEAAHRPPLATKADWIKAGQIVFDAYLFADPPESGLIRLHDVRSSAWYESNQTHGDSRRCPALPDICNQRKGKD